MDGACLDGALAPFAGDVAADALYAGPSCVLSAVDNRQDKRMRYAVLDHAPTHDDIPVFVGRFTTALDDRDLERKGSTTDGAALDPEPIRRVCGEVRHQRCTFPVLKDLPHGVVQAVATERDRLATSTPTLGRGRPASKDREARRVARTSPSMQQKIPDSPGLSGKSLSH